MDEATKALFREAKAKEWAGWMKYQAVEVIPPKEARNLSRAVQKVPTRFVLTDKNEKLRVEGQNLPVQAKARLVVLGNLEKDANMRRDAPTGSLLAQHVAFVGSMWWIGEGERSSPATATGPLT